MPIILLFVVMLFVMLMRVYMPKGTKVPGKVTHVFRLSLIERFLLQRVNLYAIGSVLFLMTVTGSISTAVEILVLLAAQILMALPVRLVLTSEGVALNNVVFRPWSDFASFSVAARRISLVGREGTRPLNVPLLADHQKEVITALRRHLPEIKARKEAGAEHRVTVG
jgi:hypothetical protein